MGLAKIRSKRVGNFVLLFSPFFFLGTGVHPHPPPTTYWCQTNLKYDFWGLGTTWPHQPPKNAGWLAPWATAKGRTPWDGASPLAQGGPPPVALSTSYRGVNATVLRYLGRKLQGIKGLERNSTIAGPGESDAREHLGAKVIVLACWTFSVTKTCKLAKTNIVNVLRHFSRSF